MSQTLALLYHEVIDDYSESGFQNKDNLSYMHKTEVFHEHVDLVLKYQALNPSLKYQFTFDDGGISNLKSARILEEKGLKGIYFITTKRIGTPGFLGEEDIRTLRKAGHSVGSHSHTHPMIFRSLSFEKMMEEWKVSKGILEEILGEEILYASVPGGDSDAKTYASAEKLGLKYLFDSEPIIEPRFVHQTEIFGRLSVKAQTTHEQLEDMLTLKNLSSLQRKRKIKGAIKKLIFPIHQYIQNKKNEQ